MGVDDAALSGLPICVLLVEDNSDDAEVVRIALAKATSPRPFRLDRATSLSAALDWLSSHSPNVILLDLGLPDATGMESLEAVRRRVPKTPIVVLTGTDRDESAFAALRAGAQDYLAKGNADKHPIARSIRYAIERGEAEAERDRLTSQLLHAQKLHALGQIAAGVAHEINNPTSWILSNLTTIGSYVSIFEMLHRATMQALKRVEVGEDPACARDKLAELGRRLESDFLFQDLQDAVRESRGGAERIREIVKELGEFVHPDEKKRTPADLNVLVENAIRFAGVEAKTRAALHRDLDTIPPLSCCPQQIEQAMINILLNAVDAIRERGTISVSTRLEEGGAVVRIRDDGVGIPTENLGKVFVPFFTTKPVGKGTGLGLHVAYKIVAAHGGTIDLTSRVGEGTEATIRLPIEGTPASNAPSTRSESRSLEVPG